MLDNYQQNCQYHSSSNPWKCDQSSSDHLGGNYNEGIFSRNWCEQDRISILKKRKTRVNREVATSIAVIAVLTLLECRKVG